MSGQKRDTIAKWLLAALAAVPALLFAYLGHFSRLIADDYCIIATSRSFNIWDVLAQYYTTWTSAYTRNVLILLLSPLDTAIAPMMPIALTMLWCAALLWALWLAFRQLRGWSASWPVLIASTLLIVSASINGMHSQQSFYWFIGGLAYTLPVPVLLLSLSIWLWAGFSPISPGRVMLAAAAVFLICFISAGMAEMHLVFQGLFLTGMIVGARLFLPDAMRRRSLALLGAGWIATAVSAAIQINSPGIYARMTNDVTQAMNQAAPMRALPEIFVKSAGATFEAIGHQPAFAGFAMIFAAALFVTLGADRHGIQSENAPERTLAARALCLGLLAQLAFAPILWLHTSDAPQLLGRFSYAYFSVLCVNGLLIVFFTLLLLFRRQAEAVIQNRGAWQACIAALLLIALALFMLTQLRSIHFRAAAFLFVSSFMMICLAWQQLQPAATDLRNRRMACFPFFASGLVLTCYGGMIAIALYGQGFIVERIFVPATFLHIALGAVWGAGLGRLIRRDVMHGQYEARWLFAYRTVSLAIVFLIGIGIVIGQLRLAPRLATFAREWDDRHEEIIRQRASGAQQIVVPELTYDFGYDLVRWHIFDTQRGARCSAGYYGVDSIIRAEDAG